MHYLDITIYCQLHFCAKDPNPTPLVIIFEDFGNSSCLLQVFSQLLTFNTLKVKVTQPVRLCWLSSFPSAGLAGIASTYYGLGQKVSLGDLPHLQASARVPHSSTSVQFWGLLYGNKE